MSLNKLIIVESPSKIPLIEKYLGKQYKVLASRGHICNIDGMKDINIRHDFETKYSIIESKRSHVESMRKIICEYEIEKMYKGNTGLWAHKKSARH